MSTPRWTLTLLLICVFPSGAALAAESASVELRAGYGFPFGELGTEGFDATSITLIVTSVVPIEARVHLHLLDDALRIGVLGSYAPGLAPDHCIDCGGSRFRLGVSVRHDVGPRYSPHFWVGGFGAYEGLEINIGSVTAAYSGWVGGVEFGADYRLSPVFTVGVMAEASAGGFLGETITIAQTVSAPIDPPALHGWFMLGLRVEADLSSAAGVRPAP